MTLRSSALVTARLEASSISERTSESLHSFNTSVIIFLFFFFFYKKKEDLQADGMRQVICLQIDDKVIVDDDKTA